MTPELYEQVYHICCEAMQLETDQRAAFLERACAGNIVLRREVDAMLAYEQREENLLTGPVPNRPVPDRPFPDRPFPNQDAGDLDTTPTAILNTDPLIQESAIQESTIQEPAIQKPAIQKSDSAATEIAAELFAPGVTLGGRYLIEKELSQGGVCAVFLARDLKLHQTPVVIKVLLNIWQQTKHKAWLEKKFKGEITALARIDHPGVVRALDVGKLPDGRSYLVMQYVSGRSLRENMAQSGMDPERVARLMRQIGQAVTAAHLQGVIHRDLKPENIMLHRVGDEEYVKLIDFGIATVYEMADAGDGQTTAVIGTRNYVAPEQLRGKPVAASDIYALGVIAYELVTGRRPFDSASIFQLYELQCEGVKVKPCDLRPALPEAAQAAILKALSFAPEDRFSSAKDFADTLAVALTGENRPAPPPARMPAIHKRWLLIGALIVVAALNIAALRYFNFGAGAQLEPANIELVSIPWLRLTYSIEAQRDPKRSPRNKPFTTFDNALFSAGDQVRFHINSPQSGSLYVVNEGPAQNDGLPSFNVLFPDTEINDSSPQIQAGQVVQIPLRSGNPQQDWFIFDQEEGVEKIWLVWSERGVPELEAVKGWANPKDRGAIRDATQRASVARYLAAATEPEVERDQAKKETRIASRGKALVWAMKLEHH